MKNYTKKELIKQLITGLKSNRVRLKSIDIRGPEYKTISIGRNESIEQAFSDETWTITFKPRKIFRRKIY
jgi:hypothetical protein